LPKTSCGWRNPSLTTVGAFTRTQAFSSAEVNRNTAPGLALPLSMRSSLLLTLAATGSAATSSAELTKASTRIRDTKSHHIGFLLPSSRRVTPCD
jgi:hypothetical protein